MEKVYDYDPFGEPDVAHAMSIDELMDIIAAKQRAIDTEMSNLKLLKEIAMMKARAEAVVDYKRSGMRIRRISKLVVDAERLAEVLPDLVRMKPAVDMRQLRAMWNMGTLRDNALTGLVTEVEEYLVEADRTKGATGE